MHAFQTNIQNIYLLYKKFSNLNFTQTFLKCDNLIIFTFKFITINAKILDSNYKNKMSSKHPFTVEFLKHIMHLMR